MHLQKMMKMMVKTMIGLALVYKKENVSTKMKIHLRFLAPYCM